MRLAFLAITTFLAGTGAAGVKLGLIPMPVPEVTLQAIRALGGDPEKVTSGEINPIRAAYDVVVKQITAPDNPERLGLRTSPVPTPDFSAVQKLMAKPPPNMQNGFPSSIGLQAQQFNNRMEDLRNYARNPGGWHGAPPQ